MKINVVIGAGQLGSRHLQGLLRLTIKQKIFVLEPSEVSLELNHPHPQKSSSSSSQEYVPNSSLLTTSLSPQETRSKNCK